MIQVNPGSKVDSPEHWFDGMLMDLPKKDAKSVPWWKKFQKSFLPGTVQCLSGVSGPHPPVALPPGSCHYPGLRGQTCLWLLLLIQ